ncbi:MAG: ABC transporter permease [Alphaproteobacteria bacterium]|nr:ABC transporter permease [Alphaproteobacteria bacterium]
MLRPQGDWIVRHADAVDKALQAIDPYGRRAATFDLSHIRKLDTTGAWLIHRTSTALQRGGAVVTVAGASSPQATLLHAVAKADQPMHATRPYGNPFVNVVVRMGAALEEAGHTLRDLVAFLGLILETLGKTLVNPRRMRATSTVYHMEQAGLNAVPIVSLISFLIGAVLAFQGSEQLKRFGGEIFTVNLVAVSFLREIGILMTAIMVAGRSGSAFTAQIGSMKLREEIDAMRTLGLDPMEVLVLPRVIALIVMVPILGFIGAMMGLLGGGLVVWMELGMSPQMYLVRLNEAVDVWDAGVAFIKAPVFGLLIAMIGCFEGMKVEGSAESVGQRTTASVVEGIFIVIVVDALFSIMFVKLGI